MKKLIGGVCVATMLAVCLTGCSSLINLEKIINTGATDNGTDNGNNVGTVSSSTENNYDVYPEFPDKFTAEKIATIDMKDKYMYTDDAGIYYRTHDNKYGIMTFDGKSDTGAIYSYCTSRDNFFFVTTNAPETDELTIENMNNVGVVDVNGKVVVPESYASIDVLNDRFIKVCEVTEQTDNKDEALVYYTDRAFALSATDEDTFFKGNWYVYDAQTGMKVDGVSGTKPYPISAYGNYIEYRNDNGEDICVNGKGEAFPEDAELFDDGSYVVKKSGKATMYDADGNKMFDHSVEEFEILYWHQDSPYYMARKYVDGKPKYFVADRKGKAVSVDFDDYPNLYGKWLLANNKLYNFSGETVYDGVIKNVSFDKFTKNAIIVTTENDEAIIIKDDKTVMAQFAVTDDMNVNTADFTVNKKAAEGHYTYYSFKDNDYTLKGSSCGPWLVKEYSELNNKNLVDTLSGETLISGYYDITDGIVVDSTFYAFGKNEDGTVDVFVIK